MSLDRDLRARFWTSLHSFLVFIFPFPIFLRFLFSFLWSPLSFIGVNIIFFFNRRFHTKVAKAWPRVPKDYSFFFFFSPPRYFAHEACYPRDVFSLSLFFPSFRSIQIERAFRMKIYRIRKIVSALDIIIYIYSFPSLVSLFFLFFLLSFLPFLFFQSHHVSRVVQHSFARGPNR